MRRAAAYTLYLIILFCFVSLNAQQQTIVRLEVDGLRQDVKGFTQEGMLFISINDLASKFRVRTFVNSQRKKIEMKFTDYKLKFTADNAFVVFTFRGIRSTEVIQLPVPILLLHGQLFAPLEYTKPLLSTCFGSPVSTPDSPEPATEATEEPTEVVKSVNEVISLSVKERANGTLVRINAGKRIQNVTHLQRDNTLKITLTDVHIDPSIYNRDYDNSLVYRVAASNEGNNATVELTLRPEFGKYELIGNKERNSVLITLHSAEFTEAADKADMEKQKWQFDVVVLDPGHGGKDPGAIGVNKSREKDINLAISQKLASLIRQQMPDVKVVETRDDDTFVELFRRGKIANENNGKLFISIHCNSIGTRNGASGAEFYLLRPGRTDKAIEIAEIENSVIQYEENPERYEELTDENFILVSMAHSSYMQYSEKFAEMLDKSFRKNTRLPSRGVKQAGFYVLVGASMPSVLVEAGFISTDKDESYLVSAEGQQSVASSIFEAIKSYRIYYEKIITE